MTIAKQPGPYKDPGLAMAPSESWLVRLQWLVLLQYFLPAVFIVVRGGMFLGYCCHRNKTYAMKPMRRKLRHEGVPIKKKDMFKNGMHCIEKVFVC